MSAQPGNTKRVDMVAVMDAKRQARPIYPTRPDDAFHIVTDDRVIGSVFRNWQGWIAAMWREHPLQAETSIHGTRELALAACGASQ